MSRSIDGIIGVGKGQPPTVIRPFDFGTDAIERQRVSLGQSIIDADFEYGLQATKWQTYQEVRKTPSFFEVPGSDIVISSLVTDTSIPAVITVTLGTLGTGRIAGPTAGGALQSSLVILFTVGSTSGTIANNQYVLGLSAYIPTGPIYISAYSASGFTLNFPSQTISSIPNSTIFTTVGPVPAVSTLAAPSVVSIYGLANDAKNADRGEGFFLVTSSVQTSAAAYFTYVAKGGIAQIPSATINTSYTVVRKGGVFNNGAARIQVLGFPIQKQFPTDTVVVTTSTTHGLIPGTPITVIGWTNGSGVTGNFFVDTVPNVNTFTYTPSGSTGVTLTGPGAIYVQPYSSIIHRPFDGGVILTPGQPGHGSNIVRQSKKVFRYQSGKGLLWSSGTLFCPNNDVVRMAVTQTITYLTGSVADASLTTSKQFTVASVSGFATGQSLTPVCAETFGFKNELGLVTISDITGLVITIQYPKQIMSELIGTGVTFATSAASTLTTSYPMDVDATTSKKYSVYAIGPVVRPVTTASGADAIPTTTRTIGMTDTSGILVGQYVNSLMDYIPVGVTTVQAIVPNTSITVGYQSQIAGGIPTTANVTVNTNAFGVGQTVTLGTYSLGIRQGSAVITTVDVDNLTLTVTYTPQVIMTPAVLTGIEVATVPAGSIMTILTDVAHGAAQKGAFVELRGVSTPGFNGRYQIYDIVESTTFTIVAPNALTTATPVLGDQPRFIMRGWHGACVRAGCFDDQNGIFWEYDGSTLYAVKRSSTFQLAGLVTVNINSQTLSGTVDNSIPTAVISNCFSANTITYGETTAVLQNITYSGGTLYRGMQCSILSNAATLGVVSVQNVLSADSAVVTFLPYIQSASTVLSLATASSGSVSTVPITYSTYTGFANGMIITNLEGYISGTVILSLVTNTSAQLNFATQVINNLPSGTRINAFSNISSSSILSGSFINVSTRFQDQLRAGDRFVIRGMTYAVTSTASQGVLTFNPPYRGSQNITVGAKICKVKEVRVPQNEFNRDTIDGNGPSGFNSDMSKMQMIGMQYTWYGAGFIDFMMRGGDGNWVYAHRMRQNNINDEAYMRTGNMPVRYEIINETALGSSALAERISATDTDIPLIDDPTYWPNFGTVLIDNEMISYESKGSFSIRNCKRSNVALTYNIADVAHSFSGALATTHSANTSINVISCTCSPSLTHWGSAFLMDGNFDSDRGYYFNYQFNNTTTLSVGATPLELYFLRLAPSVSNGIIGDIGIRELMNRAQLLLQQLDVSPVGNDGTINIQGILNPSGFEGSTFDWTPINSTGQGSQPSFCQVANKPPTGNYSIGSGERIFSMIAAGGATSSINLTALKELNNTIIGGTRMFPDGPDTLMILAQAYNQPISSCVVNLYWSEAQA